MGHLRRNAWVVALCLLSVGCASSRSSESGSAPKPEPKAFIWEAKKGEATLHIVGSVHVGREGALTPPPSMLAAFDASDVLVVELDVTQQDPAALQRLVMEKGIIPAGQPGLFSRLSEPAQAKLKSVSEEAGLPEERLDRMRPWLANIMVTMVELLAKPKAEAAQTGEVKAPAPATGGFDPKAGVDFQFLQRAKGLKEIVELETAESQLNVMASLPEEDQLLILEELLVTGKGVASQVAVTASDTWSEGDAERLDHELLDEVRTPRFAGLYKAMYTDRNRQMTDRLLQLVATPKKHFVVVGAGHVVGRDGILELLKAEGFSVRQLPRG